MFKMLLKRWSCSTTTQTILIKREGALGDVLCVEPIIRKLQLMGYCVFLETDWKEPFLYNKNVKAIFKINKVPLLIRKKSLIIDLNLAYELNPLSHVVDAYAEKVQSILPEFQLAQQENIPVYDDNIKHSGSVNNIKTICVNNEGSWASRTYDKTKMRQFVTYLKDSGYIIIEIGHNEEHYLGVGENYYGKLKLHDTVELMSKTDMYIGMDGGLMHFAQSIGLPMFVIFGCTSPNFRIHNWNIAKVMWKNTHELSCAGCHHRRSMRIITECDRESIYCLDWPVEELISTFESTPFGNKPELTNMHPI